MKTLNLIALNILGVLLFLLQSCNQTVNTDTETATNGSIIVAADETYKPILDSELMVFKEIYPDAHVKIIYMPYASLFNALNQDSIRLIFTGYSLDTPQLNEIKKLIQYYPKKAILGYDAVAFITHPDNIDLSITESDIISVLTGKKQDWKDITTDKSGKINVVFDNQNSSTAKYLLDSILNNQPLAENCFAVNNNEEVIKYVSSHPSSIGVIGVNWISNINDSSVQNFRKEIIPVRIKKNEFSKGIAPYQAYIADKTYSYCRDITALIKEAGPGLGHGFVNFVGGEKGQRIILKSGLVPATMPLRNIRVRETIKN